MKTEVYDEFVEVMWGSELGPTRDLAVASLGLAGEHAEMLEKVMCLLAGTIAVGRVTEHEKKVIRGDPGKMAGEGQDAICKELGDSLFYIVKQGQLHGLTLGDIMQANIDKLEGRRERTGTYRGSGDDR